MKKILFVMLFVLTGCLKPDLYYSPDVDHHGAGALGQKDLTAWICQETLLNDKKFAYFKTLLHSRCKKVKDGWKDYHEINDHFTPFASAYVVNTYVVQGDTYENVFVNFRDILTVKPISRKEKLQSLYTAVTRAKTHVSILV